MADAVESVRMLASCPECGGDAQWTGTRAQPGDGTGWRITCGWCDEAGISWSLSAQIARRVRRVA